MALSLTQTAALAKILKPGMRVASMGYPDIIAPRPLIQTMFNKDMPKAEYRTDSAAICKRHGMEEHGIIDAVWLFEVLKCKLDVYDVVRERGCEIICDLNNPLKIVHINRSDLLMGYDIVLDVGTAEHVINVWQALVNMASMVKVGGHILHENPHSGYTNHGFYSLHPTLFYDFYTANGFEIVNLTLATRNGDNYGCHPTKRMGLGELRDVNVFCMAKRIEIIPFSFPKQSKYA